MREDLDIETAAAAVGSIGSDSTSRREGELTTFYPCSCSCYCSTAGSAVAVVKWPELRLVFFCWHRHSTNF